MDEKHSSNSAIASLVLGAVGLIAWLIPIFGLPITITGLIQGTKGMSSPSRNLALIGLVLCAIGLAASLGNMAWGAYLGATGQHSVVNRMLR